MIEVCFLISCIVMTIEIGIITKDINRLSKEIDKIKDSFEYQKKIHKYERLMAEQKIKELIQLLDKLKESKNKKQNENKD